MSALLEVPLAERDSDGAPGDHRLVAAVRRGDDRAFEALYQRYCRRIHAYVFGMVKDHGRAEDVTQEVFVSALRRMRATERPIAFKPWIYEIAKNACIDQFRRSKRAEEVSMDADDALAPHDYGRLVSAEPIPDAALQVKQELNDLCGAFGSLSEAHHEILVLRELEGLSYREIGERMGLSRPAVESTLFRARRRLTEEYDELASGERCVRIQSIIRDATTGHLGARDTRRLARHVAHCQPCRREAVGAGVDKALLARKPIRHRVAEKVAALFPFPLLLRGKRGGGGAVDSGWAAQLPAFSDQAAAGGAGLAAAAALLVAGLGAGVGSELAAHDRAPAPRPALTASPGGTPQGAYEVVPAAGTVVAAPATRRGTVLAGALDSPRMGHMWMIGRAPKPATEQPGGGADRGGDTASSPGAGEGAAGGGSLPGGGGAGGKATEPVRERTGGPSVQVPTVSAPATKVLPAESVQTPAVTTPATPDPTKPGAQTVPAAAETVGGALEQVTQMAGAGTEAAGGLAGSLTGGR
jgi:RNA polymerase sigma factor (sigma-70 family)